MFSLIVDPMSPTERQCDVITLHVARAPKRRDAILRRDALQTELSTAMTKGSDFGTVKVICAKLEAHLKESQKIPLSEQDFWTLKSRHATLVQNVSERCRKLVELDNADVLLKLGPKLAALKSLDLSACSSVNMKGIFIAAVPNLHF